jgi:predicted nucleotidyltransferase
MSETAYTVRDSPATVERIERDLDRIVQCVRAADRRVRAVVLTGGFARGEGAVLDGAPQNDYDLIAVRSVGPTRQPYPRVRAQLEAELGLHVDLAPVPAWRLPLVPASIFWYETALRGRTLWGEDVLHRLPVRDAGDLEPSEGLRLLVNRAAGLLLVTARPATADPGGHRLQAAKGLLAAMDVHLLRVGAFPPSQRERHERFSALHRDGSLAHIGDVEAEWFHWAYDFKVDPGNAAPRAPLAAWRAARRAILRAVPAALDHAGLASLLEYGRNDGWLDRLQAARNLRRRPPGLRFAWNPTGKVRVATIRLLGATPDAVVRPEVAARCLGEARPALANPVARLEALRGVTLQ